MLAFFPLFFVFPFLLFPFLLLAFAFWIWMLISAIQNQGVSEGEKVAWALVVLFTHCLGAFIYFLVGYPKRNG